MAIASSFQRLVGGRALLLPLLAHTVSTGPPPSIRNTRITRGLILSIQALNVIEVMKTVATGFQSVLFQNNIKPSFI